MKVNSWTHWQPLKQIVLGNVYPTEFFEDVKDTKLRDLLQKVVYETKEDLDGIKKTLEDLGVEVIQVDSGWADSLSLNPYKSFGEYLEKTKENKGFVAVPKPLLAPRDHYVSMGDDLLMSRQYNPQIIIDGKHPLDMFDTNMSLANDMWKNSKSKLGPFRPKQQHFDMQTQNLSDNELWQEQDYFDMNMKHDPVNFRHYVFNTYSFDAPFITRIGDTVLVDENQKSGFIEWYNKIKPDNKFKFKSVDIGGHNDGCMCLPKPGLVLGAPWMEPKDFDKFFPGWDKMIIEHPNNFEQQYPKEYQEFKNQGSGGIIRSNMNRHIDNEMDNKPLVDFVDIYLKEWVGYMEESIFEINMLSLNEKTILSLNYQKEVHNKLKSVGIETIYTRFRHRHFWDSGLHCLTVDTNREGGCETYL